MDNFFRKIPLRFFARRNAWQKRQKTVHYWYDSIIKSISCALWFVNRKRNICRNFLAEISDDDFISKILIQEKHKMEEQNEMQNKSETPKKKVKHKGLIIASSIVGGLVIFVLTLFFTLTCNTQIIVGFLQKATYGDKPFNSDEPYYEPINGKKDNGQYLISEIKYDTDIPTATLTSLILTKTGSLTVPRCSISTAADSSPAARTWVIPWRKPTQRLSSTIFAPQDIISSMWTMRSSPPAVSPFRFCRRTGRLRIYKNTPQSIT